MPTLNSNHINFSLILLLIPMVLYVWMVHKQDTILEKAKVMAKKNLSSSSREVPGARA